MNTTLAAISRALGYDACEEILASGGSLAQAYALAAARSVVLVDADEPAPISAVAPTVRPVKKAA